MTAIVDSQHGFSFSSMPPTFSNPWGTSTTSPTAPLYAANAHLAPSEYDNLSRHSSISGTYSNNPHDYHLNNTSASQAAFTPIANTAHFTSHYSNVPTYSFPEADVSRRPSYSSRFNTARGSISDAIDASRGMVAMSQEMTPRNIYGTAASSRHNSIDYGFPSQHPSHRSSISSVGTYQSYYAPSHSGSVDGSSITDYSSASEDILAASRVLPTPAQLLSGFPPEPASMMTQFNSKATLSATKKHRCKTCDKRFTRPSSLQTHMYSHTGEKPYACDHAGCGRHFSVVSNLRRHKKVHDPNREDE